MPDWNVAKRGKEQVLPRQKISLKKGYSYGKDATTRHSTKGSIKTGSRD